MQRTQVISVDLIGAWPALLFANSVGHISKVLSVRAIRPDLPTIRAKLNVERKIAAYQELLDKLTDINRWYRANGFDLPLYSSGVRYCDESAGQEIWQSIPVLYATGLGDCEDLAPARASEIDGARAIIKKIAERPNGARLFHITTHLPNGVIEDPSKRLGMRG